ncbi:MAG TPA: sigma-70 family RNA polymerase sigma factor [Thermoanaerobaculia bacterium]|jgi:RNA polymerase sigma-70 factor (ECF subfamily)
MQDRVAQEAALVRRVCAGDRAAAAELFTTVLGATVNAVAQRWSYPDLLDDLFVHLSENDWRRLRTWQGRSSLQGWVRVICTRICREAVQGSTRLAPLTLGEDRAVVDPAEDVVDRLIREESRLGLLEAIEQLDTPRDRLVLRLHYLQEHDLPAIATQLGIPLSTVYVVKSRALDRLRTKLQGASARVDPSRR